jgi:hypothetical protein
MFDQSDLEKWSKRLNDAERLDGFISRLSQQPQELLAAFNKISDPVLREQIVILMEIISERPDLLPKHYASLSGALLH